MKKRLPRRHELYAFIAISLLCTLIVTLTGKSDVGLAVLGAPVFLLAALMGFRRSLSHQATEAVTASTPGDEAPH